MKSAWAAAPCSLHVRPGSMADRAWAARELSDAADMAGAQTRPSSSAPGWMWIRVSAVLARSSRV
ncbi:hypothetical protein D3C80_2119660 [compost metagenome]